MNMMIDKRLIGMVPESKKYVAGNVLMQWISLAANVVLMMSITRFFASLYAKNMTGKDFAVFSVIAIMAVAVRFFCAIGASRMGFLSSKKVKKALREAIYTKLLKLGAAYKEQIKTSEIVQVAVEGVDQLETYFGAYLPQFFYAMLAPLTLFLVLLRVNIPSAVVLFVCVPLIPAAIAAVQTWAKKLLSKYWGQYTALGDTFLENLQGLTTLKIYQADAFKNKEMNEESEKYRKITMKVQTKLLNSNRIMDIIAYGGAALGVFFSVTQYQKGGVDLAGALLVILLSADFFIPMRQLGSFFHIAMNGMAASEKIFRFLELPEAPKKAAKFPRNAEIVCENLRFSYEAGREILKGMDLRIPRGRFVAIAGESGCGKSTVASILMGRNRGYKGTIRIGDIELSDIAESSLMQNITYISHNSYLFKGTIRENLLMGNPNATEDEMWAVLEQTNLAAFLRNEEGLDTKLAEKASNLSGGQCQRLALARALLHDSPVYIFDEATSNIDVESENDIMEQILLLAKKKSVLLISHRLANITKADMIYAMEQGEVKECGTHEELLRKNGLYQKMWTTQQRLELYGKGGVNV